MKKIIVFLTSIAFITFIGCKSKSDDPKVVLSEFFDALSKKDIVKAKTLATESSQQMLDLMSLDMKKDNGDKEANKYNKENIVMKDAVIQGETASVEVTNKADDEQSMTFVLKKEKGAWKVAFDKETIIGMGMKAAFGKDSTMSKLKDVLKNSDSLVNEIKEGLNTIDSVQ